MAVSVFIARRIDAGLFNRVHEDVFDAPPDPMLTDEFLAAPHLHIAVAVERDMMGGGQCSGRGPSTHPDKPPQWWINRDRRRGPVAQAGHRHAAGDDLRGPRPAAGLHRHLGRGRPSDEAEAFWQSLRWSRTGTRLRDVLAPPRLSGPCALPPGGVLLRGMTRDTPTPGPAPLLPSRRPVARATRAS